MNGELLTVLDYIEREKGIDRETLIEAVEASLLTASRKSVGPARELSVEVDRKSGRIRAFTNLLVVEKVQDGHEEISLSGARKINMKAKIGDSVRVEVTPANFGRIAAQTAKQVIMQKIREAERRKIFEDYKDRVGDLVTGTVRRVERGLVILDLGRTEALLPEREQSSAEEYYPGLRLRAYIVEVKDVPGGPEIIISRSHPGLVRKLFELEVPEIHDGTVEVKSVAREAGYRTKIAVASNDSKVDPVGACVGMRGTRVKSIVRELNQEKVDIVRWDEDIVAYAANALSPAKLREIKVHEKERRLAIVADKDQLSLAIGRKGQNARLTAKLTGWKIDIQKEGSIVDKLKEAKAALASIPGVGPKMAENFADAGFLSIEGILAADIEDLQQVPGVGRSTAEKILVSAKEAYDQLVRERTKRKREGSGE